MNDPFFLKGPVKRKETSDRDADPASKRRRLDNGKAAVNETKPKARPPQGTPKKATTKSPKPSKKRERDDVSEESDEEGFFISEKNTKAESEASTQPEDPYANETPDERRVRLAKQYLEQLAAIDSDDDNGNEDGEDGEDSEGNDRIEDILQLEAFRAKTGRQFKFRSVADAIKSLTIAPESIKRKKGHQLSVTALVISEDEKAIYTVSKDCCVIKWDAATAEKQHTIKGHRKDKSVVGHKDQVLGVAISSDGAFLATGGMDKIVRVWNLSDMSLHESFSGHRDTVTGLAFRIGTHDLYTASMDRTVKAWNCDSKAYMDTLYGHQEGVTSIAAMRRERCVTTSGDKTVRSWKILEETQLVFRGPPQSFDCIDLLTEESWITGSQQGSLHLWSINKKKPIATVDNAHGLLNWISSVACLPYSDLVASGSCDGYVRLWKVQNSSSLVLIQQIPVVGWVNALKFSSSGKFLVAGIGQEHRFGRWTRIPEARNGFVIIPLTPGGQENTQEKESAMDDS